MIIFHTIDFDYLPYVCNLLLSFWNLLVSFYYLSLLAWEYVYDYTLYVILYVFEQCHFPLYIVD